MIRGFSLICKQELATFTVPEFPNSLSFKPDLSHRNSLQINGLISSSHSPRRPAFPSVRTAVGSCGDHGWKSHAANVIRGPSGWPNHSAACGHRSPAREDDGSQDCRPWSLTDLQRRRPPPDPPGVRGQGRRRTAPGQRALRVSPSLLADATHRCLARNRGNAR